MRNKRHWLLLIVLMVALTACTAGAKPTPGATFSGPIEISGKASSATLSFTVSADGALITSVGVDLSDVQCDGMSAGSLSNQTSGAFPLTNGKIAVSTSNIGEVEGRFTSPTEASGTIKLRMEQSILGQTTVCDLGTWNWSATAQ